MKKLILISSLFLALVITGCHLFTNRVADVHRTWAPTPPMGWNSFDAYDCRINESEFRANVEVLHQKFYDAGYTYAVIDYIWFNDNPGAWDNPRRRYGHPDLKMGPGGVPVERLNLDEYGRVIPSPVRFPSAKDGAGFKPLADWVHSKGMKFGIHIMRGIPRQAYFDNLPIKGTPYTARDIAEPWDTCNWNNNMFGVDGSKPGAQEYYNSLFDMFADWGVDFVKADNMMFPEYHNDDIEMMHKAILQTGRPILLSLSNGEAPSGYADHLDANSVMWRVSGDFWDIWDRLLHNFELLNKWSYKIGNGTWPDADMIPFGRISLGGRPEGHERITRFTRDEQYTLMTLWCIARSPLIIGADLLTIDDTTVQILTNPEVIALNQHSKNNRQIYSRNGRVMWMAETTDGSATYLAMFNTSDEEINLTFDFELKHMRNKYLVHDLWAREDMGVFEKKLSRRLPAHGTALFKMTRVE